MDSASLNQLGEENVLQTLLARIPSNEDVLIGPGDDCAVVVRNEKWDTLLKTDAVVEGIHFTPDTEPERIGHKALARAISDIAAMGGMPEHALITVLIDPKRPLELLKRIYAGMRSLAEHWSVSIAGGEMSSLPVDGLIISVALTGRVEHGKAVLRSGGQPGDQLFVSGRLGGSFSSGRHLDFMPRVDLARALVTSHCRPSAMMDLSDGLGSDLPRLARASHCGFLIDEQTLPCHQGCTPHQAITDGEDYELLMAFPREVASLLPSLSLPVPLTPIGQLTLFQHDSSLARGWQHFVA